MSDNLRHPAFRLLTFLPVRSKFRYNLVAVHRTLRLLNGDKNIPGELLIIRYHESIILRISALIQADYPGHSPGDDPHDLAFTASSLRFPCKYELHLISVKRTVRIFFSDIYIRVLILSDDKPKSSYIGTENACQALRLAAAVFPSLRQIYLTVRLQ